MYARTNSLEAAPKVDLGTMEHNLCILRSRLHGLTGDFTVYARTNSSEPAL